MRQRQQHNQPLRVPLMDILTEAEKDALMHHRLQLRRRGNLHKRKQHDGTTHKKKSA